MQRIRAASIALAGVIACGSPNYKHALVAQVAAPSPMAMPPDGMSVEEYEHRQDNPLLSVDKAPLSTFSIDVDTASLSNVRRFLSMGELPPADAVRIEELVNYYRYDYPQPTDGAPLAIATEVAPSPFHADRLLARIGIKGKMIATENLPPRNLVFLVDTSGSMSDENKLPLLRRALVMLSAQLTEKDHVSVVAYAGSAGVMLPPTSGEDQGAIRNALLGLDAGGSTNGAGGITLAYELAQRSFDAKGINRVILCTDGDFNVGITDQGSLVRLIEDRRRTGIYLTVLGFGMGNLKDSTMEKLAASGNGNYGYIDSIAEAKKSLVDEAAGTLVALAQDVKVQVEFNPAEVAQYRLLGYENRMLDAEDFTDDNKDAGELGVGQTVTALYELVPAVGGAGASGLKYQTGRELTAASGSGEMLTVRIRFKRPGEAASEERSTIARAGTAQFDAASADFRFAAAVAGFGMMLRHSDERGTLTWVQTQAMASAAAGGDEHRGELVQMIERAAKLSGGDQAAKPIAR